MPSPVCASGKDTMLPAESLIAVLFVIHDGLLLLMPLKAALSQLEHGDAVNGVLFCILAGPVTNVPQWKDPRI